MKSRVLKRVVIDFQRHPWLHFISVATITAALVLVGAFLVFFRNIEKVAEKTNPRVTGTLYLKEGLTNDQVRELRDKVFALEQVRQVTFKDRDSVVGEIQSFLGEVAHREMPGSEVFPDVLEVEIDPAATQTVISEVQRSLSAMPGIQEVDFSDGWLVQYKKIRKLGQFLGLFLVVALVVGCGFIIANFMGLRHQSRQIEIQVARMMGAHRGFILAPFIWEGLIEGLLGATVAVVLLYGGTFVFSQVITLEWGALLGLRRLDFLSFAQLSAIVLVGVSMALIGSVTVFFRFQENSHS
jgi:cell division transport system permease protein